MSETSFSVVLPTQSRREAGSSVLARLRSYFVQRQNRRILAAMDDRTLSDIGASRSIAVWEDSRPIWERLDTLR